MKKSSEKNFTKIRPVGSPLIHANLCCSRECERVPNNVYSIC